MYQFALLMEAQFAGQMKLIKTHGSNKQLLFETERCLLTFLHINTISKFNASFVAVQAKQGFRELTEIFSGSVEAKNKIL